MDREHSAGYRAGLTSRISVEVVARRSASAPRSEALVKQERNVSPVAERQAQSPCMRKICLGPNYRRRFLRQKRLKYFPARQIIGEGMIYGPSYLLVAIEPCGRNAHLAAVTSSGHCCEHFKE